MQQLSPFSQYFKDLDKDSVVKMQHEYYISKPYTKVMAQWQKPLEKKRIKRQQKLMNPVVPRDSEDEILYVHD